MRPFNLALAASFAVFAVAATADERAKSIRICVQFIEVAHPALTEMLAGPDTAGPQLHDKALALAKDGRAKLLESSVVMTRPGRKATVQSIREMIYQTEYVPPQLPQAPPAPPPKKPLVRPALGDFDAWETRNLGTTLEIEPWLQNNDGRMIELRFVPEIVQLLRLETFMEYVDQWGDASLRMPIFEVWRVNTSVTLMAGQFEMVGVITPKQNTPGPVTTRKLLVFVRADIVPVPTQP